MGETMKKAWKCLKLLDGKIKSDSDNHTWKISKWYEEKEIEACHSGFYASKSAIDAMSFVAPDVFAQVEYGGKVEVEEDKVCAQRMRLVKVWKWTKKDSMNFSIFCVKQSMKYVDEKKYPEVFAVCLNSIKAIEAVLLHDTAETRSAAWSAESAAWSAAELTAWSAARSAAWSAARSAESAAWSAESAAWSAESAWSAELAAWSAARSAAWSAQSAESAAKKLQHKWLVKYVTKHCEKVLE